MHRLLCCVLFLAVVACKVLPASIVASRPSFGATSLLAGPPPPAPAVGLQDLTEGIWALECAAERGGPNGRPLDQYNSLFYTFFEGGLFTLYGMVYADADCKSSHMVTQISGSYSIGARLPDPDEVYEIDFKSQLLSTSVDAVQSIPNEYSVLKVERSGMSIGDLAGGRGKTSDQRPVRFLPMMQQKK